MCFSCKASNICSHDAGARHFQWSFFSLYFFSSGRFFFSSFFSLPVAFLFFSFSACFWLLLFSDFLRSLDFPAFSTDSPLWQTLSFCFNLGPSEISYSNAVRQSINNLINHSSNRSIDRSINSSMCGKPKAERITRYDSLKGDMGATQQRRRGLLAQKRATSVFAPKGGLIPHPSQESLGEQN